MFAIELHSSPFFKRSKWLRVQPGVHVAGNKSDRTLFPSKEAAQRYIVASWGPNQYQMRIVNV